MELTKKQIERLKELMSDSAEKGNLANAAMVLEGKEVVGYSESLVTSQNDATAHAERLLVEKVCKQRENYHTSGLTMVTVVEPCLMCISACSQAGYGKIVYFIPAEKYIDQIEWMSDIKKGTNKEDIVDSFKNSIKLNHFKKYEQEFSEVFERVMKDKLKS